MDLHILVSVLIMAILIILIILITDMVMVVIIHLTMAADTIQVMDTKITMLIMAEGKEPAQCLHVQVAAAFQQVEVIHVEMLL